MENIKLYSAIAFQFLILAVLTACLFTGTGDANTILGAIIGLAVGVGIGSIKE